MLQIPCPHCGKMVVADDHLRFPPWCTKCGADLKVKPEDLAAAKPAPVAPPPPQPSLLTAGLLPSPPRTASPASVPGLQRPNYFHARVGAPRHRLYRVHFYPDELVFLDRTPWQMPPVGVMGMAFGGLLGGLAVKLATQGDKERHDARLKRMDWAGSDELQMMADEDSHSLRVRPDDLAEAWL